MSLERIRNLKKDWYAKGEGEVFSELVLSRADAVLTMLKVCALNPFACPGVDGNISIEWYREASSEHPLRADCSIDVHSDGSLSVCEIDLGEG